MDGLIDVNWDYLKKQYGFTSKELNIAKLISCGLSNKEIGAKLKITVGTVKVHVAHIYIRVHVNTRLKLLLKLKESDSERG